MGIDATASSITLVDPETGKGRVTYLCEGRPERAFVPTRGLWFTNQTPEARAPQLRGGVRAARREAAGDRSRASRIRHPRLSPQVMSQLEAEFQRQPYPSAEDMARIAKAVGAPGVAQVRACRVAGGSAQEGEGVSLDPSARPARRRSRPSSKTCV